MASPLGHVAVASALLWVFRSRLGLVAPTQVKRAIRIGTGLIFLSLWPDADAVFGIWFRDLARYHNQFSHSLITIILAVPVLALGFKWWAQIAWRDGLLVTFVASLLHIVMDYFTYGRGVMLFWPLTVQRFQSPVLLFYGLQWSHSWRSPVHLLTLLNELLFMTVLAIALWVWEQKKQSTR